MKKITILAFALLATSLVSCKKDRTCECTFSTVSQTSTQPNYTYTAPPPQTSSTKYTKVKRNSDLVKNCVTSERTSVYPQSVYNSQTQTNTYYDVTSVTKNECKIK